MNHLIRISLVAALAVASFQLQARTWHVSVSGSDVSEGTSETPFSTIGKAASVAVAGDSVIVHAGTYREWVSPQHGGLNSMRRIVYAAAPGEEVSIKGSEIVTGWKKDGRNVWKAEVPNGIFGNYNPFAINISGDWLSFGKDRHLGEIYIEGEPLKETLDLEELSSTPGTWSAEVKDEVTVIRANFSGKNPNASLVEMNVREHCFFPEDQGLDYITVKGFHFSQAAPQWAPPTGDQPGMVGPNWSKGWIIEDCVVSDSKCVGISLGKTKATGDNLWTIGQSRTGYHLQGFSREIESVIDARNIGWSKELVGSHLVQNNKICRCGQAGIVGHMGGAFSVIRHNEIKDIAVNTGFGGAETGGIKLHAAIDTRIYDNCITHCQKGLWLDWQSQGTHVFRNIFSGNQAMDLYLEVSHGPTLVYNNLMLSNCGIQMASQGVAVFNNLIAGGLVVQPSPVRYTPYHQPHSTSLKGFFNNTGGDVRFYNNVFLGNYKDPRGRMGGMSRYDEYPSFEEADVILGFWRVDDHLVYKFPVWTQGNVYYHDAAPYVKENGFVRDASRAFRMSLVQKDGGYYLETDLDDSSLANPDCLPVNTELLGSTIVSDAVFENTDGTPFELLSDFFGNPKNADSVNAGPFNQLPAGRMIWEK